MRKAAIMGLALCALLGGAAFAPPPAPDAAHEGAWEVTCDNARTCSVSVGGLKFPEAAYLRIERAGARNAAPSAAVVAASRGYPMPPAGGVMTLQVVDAAGATLFTRSRRVTAVQARQDMAMTLPAWPLIRAMTRGDHARISITGEPGARDIRLGGAWWTFDRVDVDQQRFGVSNAMVVSGKRRPDTIPALPRLPVVYRASPAPQGGLAGIAPTAVLAAHRERKCADDPTGHLQAYRLSWGRILWFAPCHRAASLDPYRIFMLTDERGRKAPGPGPFLEDGARYDPATRTLSHGWHDEKGCGELREWVWDGQVFHFSRAAASFRCVRDWPTGWRARVVDRR
ncbi:MAG: hypothetical protein JWP35_4581 [Caulobacter sp.]|nr:hypothetical protein [Caulobacter sp.]